MRHVVRAVAALIICGWGGALAASGPDWAKVWPEGAPRDPRLTAVRTLHDGSGFKPCQSKEAWAARATWLRQQVLVAAGLWPLPRRCDLNAVIHTPRDMGDYSVWKVYFQSYPGFYVTGNLYRPEGKTGPFPAVLCPHGHWKKGRFMDTPAKQVQADIAGGFEKETDAARSPLQARCANLAKLGCIVFHYDMVGYADADPEHFPHRATYTDADSDLHGISVFGLQTWDSIRAMDFVLSLSDVDPSRIACTGASGGGSQTLMLMNCDERLKVAAPVCMISAGEHQGGCVCENNSLLRIDTDNAELACTFAPKPFVHPTATGDWTQHYLEHGFPELQAIYRLFNAEDQAQCVRYQSGHNYNLKSREAVYNFFNKHLRLGWPEPVIEQKFHFIPAGDLSVFDAAHPRPANSIDAPALKKYLIAQAQSQLDEMRPSDAASLAQYRNIMTTALKHLLAADWPVSVNAKSCGETSREGFRVEKLVLAQSGGASIPALAFVPPNAGGAISVVICPGGKADLLRPDGSADDLLAGLLSAGQTVIAPDVYQTGELAGPKPPAAVAGKPVEFRYGYNRTPLANRVNDILIAIAYARSRAGQAPVNLIGVGKAGPWCLLARTLAGDAVTKTAADADHFDFSKITSIDDENYLPGVLHYGGLWPLAAAAPATDLLVYNLADASSPPSLLRTYQSANAPQRLHVQAHASQKEIAQWIAAN